MAFRLSPSQLPPINRSQLTKNHDRLADHPPCRGGRASRNQLGPALDTSALKQFYYRAVPEEVAYAAAIDFIQRQLQKNRRRAAL